MKTISIYACLLVAVLMVGCATPPVVSTRVPIPSWCVWDGYEWVSFHGNQYVFYSEAGDVWLTCDKAVLGRFHAWMHEHRNNWHDYVKWNQKHGPYR